MRLSLELAQTRARPVVFHGDVIRFRSTPRIVVRVGYPLDPASAARGLGQRVQRELLANLCRAAGLRSDRFENYQDYRPADEKLLLDLGYYLCEQRAHGGDLREVVYHTVQPAAAMLVQGPRVPAGRIVQEGIRRSTEDGPTFDFGRRTRLVEVLPLSATWPECPTLAGAICSRKLDQWQTALSKLRSPFVDHSRIAAIETERVEVDVDDIEIVQRGSAWAQLSPKLLRRYGVV